MKTVKEKYLVVGADFAGYPLKEAVCAHLRAKGWEITDVGVKSDSDPNKTFDGERPSSLIHGKQLNPESMGALLAHFENKIMFQGFLWNLNSFDQEGVQLGKKLTKQVLAGEVDGALKAYSEIFDISFTSVLLFREAKRRDGETPLPSLRLCVYCQVATYRDYHYITTFENIQ